MGKKLFFLLLLLCSCAGPSSQLVSLKTDNPAYAAYAEYYNSLHDRYKVQIEYSETPALDLFKRKKEADVYMGAYLAAPELLESFDSLQKLLDPEIISPDIFYPALLQNGVYEEKQVLLPLSFSLPMVIFYQEGAREDIPSLILPLDMMKEHSLSFFPEDKRKYAFSPFWDPEMLFCSSMLMGANFRGEAEKTVTWDADALSGTVDFFKNWLKDYGSLEEERSFSLEYMNIPPYKLLSSGKILYYFASSEYLFQIPKEKRKGLDFRWLSRDQKISVEDDVAYVGISRKAANPRGARNFVQWLFSPAVQKKLLELNNSKQIRDQFGIANRFSSIIEINETHIPQHYEIFVGHIPEAGYMSFPGQFPVKWPELKQSVVIPWMREQIIIDDNTKKLENLMNF